MTNQGSTPAGWYPAPGDPPGTHRYWDGSQWTTGLVTSAIVLVVAANAQVRQPGNPNMLRMTLDTFRATGP